MADTTDIVFTPQQVSTLAMQVVGERRTTAGTGVRLGIPNVDKDFLPLRPGELCAVIGRPSNYKTGLMLYAARHETKKIQEECTADRECVIYVTWEIAVEESGLIELANATHIDVSAIAQGTITDQDWDNLMRAAVERAVTPLWVIGHSLANRKKRPSLTMTDVARALTFIENEMGYHPRLIVLDYLQQIQPEKSTDRRIQVMENVHRAKDMALALGCPVMLGVQAKREVDERKFKLPVMGDGMETSNIEHTADKILTVWMPKTSEEPNSEVNGIAVTDNLLLFGLAKQRYGVAGRIYALHVEPATNEIYEMDIRHVELNR
jgi:replicative DNA helicase